MLTKQAGYSEKLYKLFRHLSPDAAERKIEQLLPRYNQKQANSINAFFNSLRQSGDFQKNLAAAKADALGVSDLIFWSKQLNDFVGPMVKRTRNYSPLHKYIARKLFISSIQRDQLKQLIQFRQKQKKLIENNSKLSSRQLMNKMLSQRSRHLDSRWRDSIMEYVGRLRRATTSNDIQKPYIRTTGTPIQYKDIPFTPGAQAIATKSFNTVLNTGKYVTDDPAYMWAAGDKRVPPYYMDMNGGQKQLNKRNYVIVTPLDRWQGYGSNNKPILTPHIATIPTKQNIAEAYRDLDEAVTEYKALHNTTGYPQSIRYLPNYEAVLRSHKGTEWVPDKNNIYRPPEGLLRTYKLQDNPKDPDFKDMNPIAVPVQFSYWKGKPRYGFIPYQNTFSPGYYMELVRNRK